MDFGSHLKCPHHSELVRKEPEDHQIETIEPKRIDVVENSILVWQSSRMRNFFVNSISNDLFWGFFCLIHAFDRRRKKGRYSICAYHWVEQKISWWCFWHFLWWCLRTKSVLKFRFSNDVSGLFTYSIKSFQFVFITVSLSDEKVEWIFFSESKGEAVYYIFYKMHFLKKPFQSWKWKCSGGKKKAYTRQETEVL